MKKPTAKTFTKRQRKLIWGRNFAEQQSLKNGFMQIVGGTEYVGAAPEFAPIRDPKTLMITGYRQISKGVPFVRAEPKRRYIA